MEYFIDIHPGGKNFIKSIIRKDPNYIKAEPGIKEEMKINEARNEKSLFFII